MADPRPGRGIWPAIPPTFHEMTANMDMNRTLIGQARP
jgi:hypothetical protein